MSQKRKIVSIFVSFFSLIISLIFLMLSGMFYPNTSLESAAGDIAKLADCNSSHVNISYKLENNDDFFSKNELISELSRVRINNDIMFGINSFQNTISFDLGTKISFNSYDFDATIILSSAFSNHTDSFGNIILDSYFFKLMYANPNTSYSNFDNFCYITQKTADNLIASNGNYKSYEDLINTGVEINYDSNVYSWKIANIIVEYGDFYDGCEAMFDNFIVSYCNLPTYEYCYKSSFFYNDVFFNYNKLKSLIHESDDLFIYTDNLKEDSTTKFEIIMNKIEYCKNNSSLNYLTYIFVSLSAILFIIFGIFFWRICRFKYMFILNISIFLIVYIIFSSIFFFTKNFYAFSYFGCTAYFVVLIINCLLYFSNKISDKISLIRKKHD